MCIRDRQCTRLVLMLLFFIHPNKRTDVVLSVGWWKRCCCRTRRQNDTRYALTILDTGSRDTHEVHTYKKGQHPNQQKKNTRHMYTAVHTLAADGHVGRSRVRNPAPRYLISSFMFSFLCATHTRYTRTIKGKTPTKKKKTRDTCIQQCTRLLLMGM